MTPSLKQEVGTLVPFTRRFRAMEFLLSIAAGVLLFLTIAYALDYAARRLVFTPVVTGGSSPSLAESTPDQDPALALALPASPENIAVNPPASATTATMDGDPELYNIAASVTSRQTLASLFSTKSSIDLLAEQCGAPKGVLSLADRKVAEIAWSYFRNNFNAETGLVNSIDGFPITSMWDAGSSLAAFIAARDFQLIEQKEFDDAIVRLLATLKSIELFDGQAPNKVYNTRTLAMVDYRNEEVAGGIGIAALDLARFISWANTLQCMHPKFGHSVTEVLSRWDYSQLIADGQMYGLARDRRQPGRIEVLQEGRLGYEQYAGKIYSEVGFDIGEAASYDNAHVGHTEILGVRIAHDRRDPRSTGANNYVVTESYTIDAMELGIEAGNRTLLENIYEVQRQRWLDSGIVTAVSEDNLDREPWFIYNTVYNAGQIWQTATDTGVEYEHLKAISTKSALSLAALFPARDYTQALLQAVESAYDQERGWYAGVYENGDGYNKAITANTNGVILSILMYKKYGSTFEYCNYCGREATIKSSLVVPSAVPASSPGYSDCEQCPDVE